MEGLPDEALAQVAAYFQALSEPTRLQILNLLRQGERSTNIAAELPIKILQFRLGNGSEGNDARAVDEKINAAKIALDLSPE